MDENEKQRRSSAIASEKADQGDEVNVDRGRQIANSTPIRLESGAVESFFPGEVGGGMGHL
jgi:hypothetical protein